MIKKILIANRGEIAVRILRACHELGILAERCQKEGIVFIGPTGESLQYMGRKIRTRAFMDDVRIPVISGHSKAVEDENEAAEIARKTGFPIMLKAVSGGGGRGIRLVKS